MYCTKVGGGTNNWISKGTSDNVAIAFTGPQPSPYCNYIPNNSNDSELTSAYIIFNRDVPWNLDCQAFQQTCITYGMYDFHNVSTHEAGHWFVQYDAYSGSNFALSMYGYADPAGYIKRDLHSHDKTSGCIMYGYLAGGSC